jgi:hypothetical protein
VRLAQAGAAVDEQRRRRGRTCCSPPR